MSFLGWCTKNKARQAVSSRPLPYANLGTAQARRHHFDLQRVQAGERQSMPTVRQQESIAELANSTAVSMSPPRNVSGSSQLVGKRPADDKFWGSQPASTASKSDQ